MAPVNKNTKKSTGDVKALSGQLKGVAAAAKSLGIDTRKADAMVSQTERQGSRSFAGSREEKAYTKDIQANPIPVTGMQPQTPAILPPTPTPAPLPTGTAPTDLATYYGLATNTATTDTATTGATGTAGAPATDPFLQAMQMQKDLFEKESPNAGKELSRLERQYDITQKQADVTNLKGQLGAITANAQQQQLALENQGRGITTDILSTQAYEIQRRATISALPIAAQLDAAQGDLQMAQQRVDRLFQVRMADATAQYNFKSKVIDSIANYADKQETKRLEQVRWNEQKEMKKQEQNFSLVSDWAKMAFESGQSTLGGKIMALDPASPTFKTDFARLQGQVVKPQQATIPTTRDFSDGTTRMWDPSTKQWEIMSYAAPKAGTLTPQVMEQQLVRDSSTIQTIDALKTDAGMKKAVGTWALARWTPLRPDVTTGKVSNFISSVDQLTKDLTLDKLISAKAEGATFGALSEGELRLLSDSASKINSWRRTDEGGNTTHYQTSEASFKKELDNISNFRKLDFVLKGGNPTEVNVSVMPDGTLWSMNSDGTVTQLR